MATLPVGSDIASFGFGSPAIGNYLNSPQFKANTTYGELMGINPSVPTGGFGAGVTGMSGTGAGGLGGLMSLDGLKLIGGGLSTIGNLWTAFQAQKLAKEQFNFQKDFATTNLANSIKTYNTALEDRAVARGFTQGDSDETTRAYIEKNRLSRD